MQKHKGLARRRSPWIKLKQELKYIVLTHESHRMQMQCWLKELGAPEDTKGAMPVHIPKNVLVAIAHRIEAALL